MDRRTLSDDELGLIACAIRHRAGFPVRPEYLADADRLHRRGWLDRQPIGDQLVWSLSDRGLRRSNAACLSTR